MSRLLKKSYFQYCTLSKILFRIILLHIILLHIILLHIILLHIIFLFKISHYRLMSKSTINTSNCTITTVITSFIRFLVTKMLISLLVDKHLFRSCRMFFIQCFSILTNRFYNFRVSTRSWFFLFFIYCRMTRSKRITIRKSLKFLNNHL